MHVCMYVYVYVCKYEDMYVLMYEDMYVCMYVSYLCMLVPSMYSWCSAKHSDLTSSFVCFSSIHFPFVAYCYCTCYSKEPAYPHPGTTSPL